MDAIRLRQIDEALGYDKKINTMVFGIEKKRVARYRDERPESQYDADAETTTKDNIHALPVLLGNRYANISIMQRPGIDVLSDQFSNASKEVFQAESVVQIYNTAVAPLASNQNAMFRQTTSNQMRGLLNVLGALIKGLTSLANHMAEGIDGAGTHAHVFYFVRCVESLAAFDLIDHYLRSDKLIQILHGDVEAHAWDLITNKPVGKRIATHDRVKGLFRNFDVSATGTNGGPPPPPPRGSPPRPAPGGGPEPPPPPRGGPPGDDDDQRPPPPQPPPPRYYDDDQTPPSTPPRSANHYRSQPSGRSSSPPGSGTLLAPQFVSGIDFPDQDPSDGPLPAPPQGTRRYPPTRGTASNQPHRHYRHPDRPCCHGIAFPCLGIAWSFPSTAFTNRPPLISISHRPTA